MRAPAFWWQDTSAAATLLAPVAAGYGAVAARRMAQTGRTAPVPVVCVGNFTVGGGGKTPTAIALARMLLEDGRHPFFLSRGHGGRLSGPVRIPTPDPVAVPGTAMGADDVGDEPLLLARVAPTIVARDRPAGAVMAARAGADVVVMDDGLQNPSLAKSLAIAVVDGRRGIGNGRVFPAGPLRAPLEVQLDHVDAVLLVGPASAAADRAMAAGLRRGVPLLRAVLRPEPDAVARLAGRPALAFAGIADPGKFFATLDACGIPAVVRIGFADHHRYAEAELRDLIVRADREHLALVTTEKDAVRLGATPAAGEVRARLQTVPVALQFDDAEAVAHLVAAAISDDGRIAVGAAVAASGRRGARRTATDGAAATPLRD